MPSPPLQVISGFDFGFGGAAAPGKSFVEGELFFGTVWINPFARLGLTVCGPFFRQPISIRFDSSSRLLPLNPPGVSVYIFYHHHPFNPVMRLYLRGPPAPAQVRAGHFVRHHPGLEDRRLAQLRLHRI